MPKARHVAVAMAVEQPGQAPIGFLMGGTEIVQESIAGGPAPFRRRQYDDWATAVKNSDQARGLTPNPGSGNQVRCFVARYAQSDQCVYG